MLDEILKNNEGKTLEFKENVKSLSGIIKTIIAFANTAGGSIIIGIEDKTKKIIGVQDPLAEEERLASAINESIAPLLMPDIEIQSYNNKELIIINVPHVTGPCYLKSVGPEKGAYIRLGSTNRIVDNETLQSLRNFARNVCFDELPDVKGKVSDLNWEVIKELFGRVNKKITVHNAQSVGLITQQNRKEVPTFGGIILFGNDRLKQFPEAIIRCARFLGNSKENTMLDQANIETYLPLALEETLKFIQRNTRLGAEIKELRRKDIPEYPPLALREALTNAIVHADYSISGVYISVAIFDNRIEITNPGSLPFGFTLEKALAGASRIRNRVIAKVFLHMRWVEQWGTGLRRIISECNAMGMDEPKFEELNNQFRVTLYATKQATAHEPWQKNMISLLKKREKITTKDAAAFWKVTSRSARLRLIKLIDAGLIKKTGTSLKDPQGGYVLK